MTFDDNIKIVTRTAQNEKIKIARHRVKEIPRFFKKGVLICSSKFKNANAIAPGYRDESKTTFPK
jgi:hypothetical protein